MEDTEWRRIFSILYSPTSILVFSIFLGASVFLWLPRFSTAAEPARRPSYAERFGIIEQHNIFLRDRSRPSNSRTTSSTQPSRRSAEEMLVLTGIVAEAEGFRAYVEDESTASVLKLGPGDAVGHGHVTAITIDSIAVEQNGQKLWIELGHNLAGRLAVMPAAVVSTSVSTTSPSTAPAGAEAANPSPGNLSIEEAMKLKRKKELAPK